MTDICCSYVEIQQCGNYKKSKVILWLDEIVEFSIHRQMNETSDYRMTKQQTISLMEEKCKIKSKIARDIFINLCSITKNTLINPRVCIDIQLRYPRLYRNILLLQEHCNDKTRIFSLSLSRTHGRRLIARIHLHSIDDVALEIFILFS